MRTTITLDDDLAIRLERYRQRFGSSFRQAINQALRAGLGQLEEHTDVTHEIRVTQPLRLGRRIGGNIDDIGEALAIAEGEDFR